MENLNEINVNVNRGTRSQITRRQKSKPTRKWFKCPYCSSTFVYKKSLKSHCTKKHKNKSKIIQQNVTTNISESVSCNAGSTSNQSNLILVGNTKSYNTSWSIVKSGLSETFSENWSTFVTHQQQFSNAQQIELYNFRDEILEMCQDVELQLLNRVNASPHYSIQIGEFEDITNFPIIIVIVRYIFESKIQEDLLFAKPHPFSSDEILTKFMCSKVDWKKCIGISLTADTLNQTNIPADIPRSYNLMRRAALVKQILPELFDAMVKFFNEEPARFKRSADDMYPEFAQLLFNTRDFWMSHSRNLPNVLSEFHLTELQPGYELFIHVLHLLNSDFNEKLIKEDNSIFKIYHQIKDAQDDLLNIMSNQNLRAEIPENFNEHLTKLRDGLNKFLPFDEQSIKRWEWIQRPFDRHEPQHFSENQNKQLLVLRRDKELEDTFEKVKQLDEFWIHAKIKIPDLATDALKKLLTFKNSHMCELAFAKFVDIRTKYLTNKDCEIAYLRLQLSSIKPSQIN